MARRLNVDMACPFLGFVDAPHAKAGSRTDSCYLWNRSSSVPRRLSVASPGRVLQALGRGAYDDALWLTVRQPAVADSVVAAYQLARHPSAAWEGDFNGKSPNQQEIRQP